MAMDSGTKYSVGDLVTVYYVGFENSRKNMGVVIRELTYREIVDLIGPADTAVDSYVKAGTYEVYDFQYEQKFIFHGDYLSRLS